MYTDYIEYLKDSNTVWDFQQYFGIRKVFKKQETPPIRFQYGSSLKHDINEDCQSRETLSNGIINHELHFRKTENKSNGSATVLSNDSGLEETVSESDSCDGSSEVKYEILNKWWYCMFSFGTALGDENFYASFFPFWCWNIDGAVIRRVVVLWVIIMYIGQGLKDIICWPRPSCPPAVRLEHKWALEYGMPSTHAMVAVVVPFSLLFFTMFRYEYPVFLGIILCCSLCALVCCSRIYMGMHTVLDVIVGLVLAVLLMALFFPFMDSLDHLLLTHPYAPLFTVSVILVLVLVYPSGKRWTPARGDTTVILGVGAGYTFGSWLNFQLGIIRGPPMPPPYSIIWPTYEMAGLTLLRTCIGILVVVATRAFFKSICYIIICWILRLDPKDKENRHKIVVELSCKFCTYAVLGFNITYLVPGVFRFLNIERVTMFTEV